MKNLLLWYLPQGALFCLGVYAVIQRAAETGEPVNNFAAMVVGAMLAAAYTGGVNLLLNTSRSIREKRLPPRQQHPDETVANRAGGQRLK